MTRREVLTLLVLLAGTPRRLDARGQQKPKPSKPATVTLTIEGMT
jgi:hypothetical protein